MIDKLDLVSIISKYHLGGMVEQVRWEIQSNNLGIGFSSPSNGLLGRIDYNNFPLEDSTVAFSNTTRLVKLISITGGYLNLEYTKQNKLPTKLVIADNQYTLDYALADLSLIPNAGELKGEFNYAVVAEIDNESISAIVKAKQALADSNTVVLSNSLDDDGEDRLELCFGGNISHANKVSFYLPDVSMDGIEFTEHYNSDLIKEIMYNNKDMSSGKLSLCLQNNAEHMKLEFEGSNLKSTYYLAAKEK